MEAVNGRGALQRLYLEQRYNILRRVPSAASPSLRPHPARPHGPARPSSAHASACTSTATSLCPALLSERQQVAKILKHHRKALEKRLQAVPHADAHAPVVSDLISELRAVNERLSEQRTDAHRLVGRPGTLSGALSVRALSAQGSWPHCTNSSSISGRSVSTTMVVSGRDGVVEVAVPEPPAGWEWDEAEFRGMAFEGSGRVMMCTGSKCQRKGATELLSAVSALAAGSPGVEVVPCKCVGACSKGAAMRVRQQGQRCAVYTQLTPQQLPGIFAQHFDHQQQGSGGQEALVASREAVPAVAVTVADADAEARAVGVVQHQHAHQGQPLIVVA